jgi:hypothetical protein
VRFQVPTTTSIEMTFFWDGVLCSLVEIDQCLRSVHCLHHQGYEHDVCCNPGVSKLFDIRFTYGFSLQIAGQRTKILRLHMCTNH